MEFLLNRYRNLSVLLVVIFAQLLLLAYQVKGDQDVRLIRVWAVTAVTPVARVIEVVRSHTVGFLQDYFVLLRVRDDNRRLHDDLGRLKLENQFLRNELSMADRAKALASFQSLTPSRTIAARVIAMGTGANSKAVFVDRGSVSGVMRGMAVVTPDGIAGKVIASYPTASQVLLITDPTFAAGVMSQKNRVHGTLKGQGRSDCMIDYVQNEETVEPGEWFYTSGDDRVFPKGLPVGQVNVARNGKTFKEIYLVPSGLQSGLEELLIVLEGVHQAIPDVKTVAGGAVSILPPPDAGSGASVETALPSGLVTDADKLRERYRKIGEAQKHVFGEGLPGSKPPDFNLNPDAVKRPSATPGAAAEPAPAVRPGEGARERGSEGATNRPPAQTATGVAKPEAGLVKPTTGPAKPATVNPGPPKTAAPGAAVAPAPAARPGEGARERGSEGATNRPPGVAKPEAGQAKPATGPAKPATVNPGPPKTAAPGAAVAPAPAARPGEGATNRPPAQTTTGVAKPESGLVKPTTGPAKPATVNPGPPKTAAPTKSPAQTSPVPPRPKPAPGVPADPPRQ